MKKSYLYLLVDADSSAARFKMGHSTDPYHRQKTLLQEFDLQRSLQLPFDRSTVHLLETHLHERYATYQVDPTVIGDCQGRNEWFGMTCFDDAVAYITTHWASPEPVEKGRHRIIVPVPDELYLRMKLACIQKNMPVQQAVIDLIAKAYGESSSEIY